MSSLRYRAHREKIGELNHVLVTAENEAGDLVPPVALAVFCHGFGAGGDDLVGLAGELLQMSATENPLALAFPAAPISLESQGMPGSRAWWLLSIQRLINALDDGRFDEIRQEVPEGISEARTQLTDSIEQLLQRYRLDEKQLLLGGFSQGAMLSVETACHGLKSPPAALCLYSGALICESRWRSVATRLADTKILQSHGSLDMVLPLQTGIWLRDMLLEAGAEVDFVEFYGPHTIAPAAIEKTGVLLSQLAESTPKPS
ncbi:MAG: hypothetical protein KDB22_26380 [Planctomycetales bacterium]|nr:hypothetical protein [Planctomycetales bacterium]